MGIVNTLAKGLNFVDKTFGTSWAGSVLPIVGQVQSVYYGSGVGGFVDKVGAEFIKGFADQGGGGQQQAGYQMPGLASKMGSVDPSSSGRVASFKQSDPRQYGWTDRAVESAKYVRQRAETDRILAQDIARVMPNIMSKQPTLTLGEGPEVKDIG